jgi:hypothetical protein
LKQAQDHVAAGHEIAVDVDLEKFFDRVNHDVLMSRLSRWVGDKRLLRIIRRFLEAGMLQNGVKIRRVEGTPQGGALTYLHWWQTFCSTIWTRNWKGAATGSAGTPTIATSMFAPNGPESG